MFSGRSRTYPFWICSKFIIYSSDVQEKIAEKRREILNACNQYDIASRVVD
jgi:hypothetical protein